MISSEGSSTRTSIDSPMEEDDVRVSYMGRMRSMFGISPSSSMLVAREQMDDEESAGEMDRSRRHPLIGRGARRC